MSPPLGTASEGRGAARSSARSTCASSARLGCSSSSRRSSSRSSRSPGPGRCPRRRCPVVRRPTGRGAHDRARERHANRVPGSPAAAERGAVGAGQARALRARDVARTVGGGRRRARQRRAAGTSPPSSRARSTRRIVVVAHRDNNGRSAGANDNASGTAALIELARAYARAGTTESARTPLHTLVFLSPTVARTARSAPRGSPRGRRSQTATVAVVSLDGLAGSTRTRLELAGLGGRSPPPALVRTAEERIAAETGRCLRSRRPHAARVVSPCPSATASRRRCSARELRRCASRPPPTAARPAGATSSRGWTGAAGPARAGAESLVASLDAAVELPAGTARRRLPRRPRRPRLGDRAAASRRGDPVRRGARRSSRRGAGGGGCRSRRPGGRCVEASGSGSGSSRSSASPRLPARSRTGRDSAAAGQPPRRLLAGRCARVLGIARRARAGFVARPRLIPPSPRDGRGGSRGVCGRLRRAARSWPS